MHQDNNLKCKFLYEYSVRDLVTVNTGNAKTILQSKTILKPTEEEKGDVIINILPQWNNNLLRIAAVGADKSHYVITSEDDQNEHLQMLALAWEQILRRNLLLFGKPGIKIIGLSKNGRSKRILNRNDIYLMAIKKNQSLQYEIVDCSH